MTLVAVTQAASGPHSDGQSRLRSALAAAMAAGRAPITGTSVPSRDSSPSATVCSTRSAGIIAKAAKTDKAMGKKRFRRWFSAKKKSPPPDLALTPKLVLKTAADDRGEHHQSYQLSQHRASQPVANYAIRKSAPCYFYHHLINKSVIGLQYFKRRQKDSWLVLHR